MADGATVYSPFVIEQLQNGSKLIDLSRITVHNRFDFTDLAELNITWRALDPATEHSGVGHVKGPPHSRGNELVLEGLDVKATRRLELNVSSPRAFLVNTWHLGAEPSSWTEHLQLGGLVDQSIGGPPVVKVNADGSLSITAGEVVWTVSAAGSLSATLGGAAVLERGPALMVLATHTNDFSQLTETNDRSYSPATDTLDGWTAKSKPSFNPVGSNAVRVTIAGSYKQAHGGFDLTFDGTGRMNVAFAFSWVGAPISPRQIGVVFDLSQGVERLSWKRRGQFTYYGTNDIGRNEAGDVLPRPCGTYFGFSGDACGYSEATAWADDSTPMGTADFRSTRDAVLTYSLCAQPQERACVRLLGNGTVNGEPGTLSARAWLNGSSVRLLAATLSNEGGNSFTQPIAILPHVKLANGSLVNGEVTLQVQ